MRGLTFHVAVVFNDARLCGGWWAEVCPWSPEAGEFLRGERGGRHEYRYGAKWLEVDHQYHSLWKILIDNGHMLPEPDRWVEKQAFCEAVSKLFPDGFYVHVPGEHLSSAVLTARP